MVHNAYACVLGDPKLLGGNAVDLREIKLEPKHLKQQDKSLNAALWSYTPIDVPPWMEYFGPPCLHDFQGHVLSV